MNGWAGRTHPYGQDPPEGGVQRARCSGLLRSSSRPRLSGGLAPGNETYH